MHVCNSALASASFADVFVLCLESDTTVFVYGGLRYFLQLAICVHFVSGVT